MILNHWRFCLGETEGMFEVQPWEVESDDIQQFGLHQVIECKNEKWNVGFDDYRSRWPTLIFWRSGGPLLTGNSLGPLNSPLNEFKRDFVRDAFIKCLSNKFWDRQLFLNEQFQLRNRGEATVYILQLLPDGEGLCVDKTIVRLWTAPFRWEAQEDFLMSARADEVMAHLAKGADFQLARRFSSMSSDEKWREVWTWKRGDHHELERVLTWALLAQEELWHTLSGIKLCVDLLHANERKGRVLFSDQFGVQDADEPEALPLALGEAVTTALAWFGPTLNTAHVEAHLCLKQLLDDGIWRIKIEPKNLTAHERTEAAIKWREWLAEHGASA